MGIFLLSPASLKRVYELGEGPERNIRIVHYSFGLCGTNDGVANRFLKSTNGKTMPQI